MASLISVGQVLDYSLEHCRKHFKELLAISLWVVIASIPSIIGKLLAPSGGDDTITGGDWLSFSFSSLGALLVTAVSIWVFISLVLTVHDQAAGRRVNLKGVYQQAWKKFLAYVLLSIVIFLIVVAFTLLAAPGLVLLFLSTNGAAAPILGALGTPLFMIGAFAALFLLIKYSVLLAFSPYILLLENQGVAASLRESTRLVQGRWWATFLRFMLPKLLYLLALLVVSFVLFTGLEVLIALLVNTSPVLVLIVYTLSLFLSVFLSAIVTPLILTTDYYLYDSLRKTS